MLIHVREPFTHELLGQTRDDAAGEAFDKVAKLLGLGYPGGPVIDKMAKEGDPKAFKFPRAFMDGDSFEFSFSGIKTSVLYLLKELKYDPDKPDEKLVRDICASFQAAVIDVLVAKAINAARKFGVKSIVVAGGVAANRGLRSALQASAESIGAKAFFPRPLYCTDNAAMIGIAAHFKYLKTGMVTDLTLKPTPNLALSF
jgi:N6-L-threonylcarbamoyladenine synthase